MKQLKKHKVYKYTSPSGKVYIGQTCQTLCQRSGGSEGVGYKGSTFFFHAIQKYGFKNFKCEIIADGLTQGEANWLERYMIAYYQSSDLKHGYNLCKGGLCRSDYERTQDLRERQSQKMLGRKHSEETKRKIGLGNKGKKRSQEECERISNMRKGVPHTEEYKRKLSTTNKIACANLRKKVLCVETGIVYDSVLEAATALGFSRYLIPSGIHKGTNYAKGYHWKYVS